MSFDRSVYMREVGAAVMWLEQIICGLSLGKPSNLEGKPWSFKPQLALTLGSGLGDLAEQIEVLRKVPYGDIPNFPKLTVAGHKGELIMGYIRGVPVIGLFGRKHYYEMAGDSYGMMQVVFPIHVMACLGIPIYFATNAVGGLRAGFGVGDMMIIRDHIDLFMPDPLIGPHMAFDANLPYFQPQHTEYDADLREMFKQAAILTGNKQYVHEGVYVARTGRTYESAATSRALRLLGADAVGMSVIPEVIVATNHGMKTMAVSLVTNVIAADGTNATSHKKVMKTLDDSATKQRLANVFLKFFELYRLGFYR